MLDEEICKGVSAHWSGQYKTPKAFGAIRHGGPGQACHRPGVASPWLESSPDCTLQSLAS